MSGIALKGVIWEVFVQVNREVTKRDIWGSHWSCHRGSYWGDVLAGSPGKSPGQLPGQSAGELSVTSFRVAITGGPRLTRFLELGKNRVT